ncbi:hypothetical protein [Nocardia pseudovaccinii]|uniref:hypothetical protein n=1 Tax=Nocardia pseudovaccinii TaxID=189540 RepID=UPI000A7C93ED|nr:hypothetical protein [Nocardia pseudovaccinii]
MIDADRMMNDYLRRTRQRHHDELDTAYQYEMKLMRNVIRRLAVIMEDEQIPDETITHVIRGVLYGAPSEVDAEMRMQQHEAMTKLAQTAPLDPSVWTMKS